LFATIVAMNTAVRVEKLENEGAYAVLAAAQALESQGRDIIHLEIGQPGFPSPPHVVEAGVAAIKNGNTKCVMV
jgi:aspartate/methionine/tyrosine aminotransferase